MNFTFFERHKLAASAFGLAIMFVSVSISDAQTRRRKKAVKKPVAVATIVRPQAEPLIISRAEDFPDTGSLMSERTAAERLVEPAGTADTASQTLEDLANRIKGLEALKKVDYDTKQ